MPETDIRTHPNLLHDLVTGIDLTVEDLANLNNSLPDLILYLTHMWCTHPDGTFNADRFANTRVGTLCLPEEGEPAAQLILKLRFPVGRGEEA